MRIKDDFLNYRYMQQVKSYFLRVLALVFVFVSLYACNSAEDKKESNEQIQDADKTEMMEEEHQMDPIEKELMQEDSSHMNHDDEMIKD